MQESGCTKPVSVREMRVESLPFASIPGQSKLFLDYLKDPLSLTRFYPSAVEKADQVAGRSEQVLTEYRTDRNRLCDALVRMADRFGQSAETAANIERLRESDCVAVLTGQQTGLFTGPLYSIYKAVSAVKLASELTEKGVKAVPVFWMATEDHDLEEVSRAFAIGSGGELVEARLAMEGEGNSVGRLTFPASIAETVDTFFDQMPETEFTSELRSEIIEKWRPGSNFGDAFGNTLTGLLGKYGLIIVDPLDEEIKALAAPMYVRAIEKSEEIVKALNERGAELAGAGYHAQVLVEPDYFPLFYHLDSGQRVALRTRADGTVYVKGERSSRSISELAELAASEPARFSPGVMLRSVVQDHLFPTIAYFGGGAEIAYFAQNSEVYRVLERPVTPILHRQSFTVVEARHSRTLEKYGIEFADLFRGEVETLPMIVDRFIDPEAASIFTDAEKKIDLELHRLDQMLTPIDSTLAANLATRRRKVLYHIGALRKKYQFRRAEIDETIGRRVTTAFTELLPNGQLQERTLSAVSFLDRLGPAFIDIIFGSIDLNDKGHRVVFL